MKIGILGPITSPKYYGGVAIFDEEIAVGFQDNGCQAVIFTEQQDVTVERNGIRVRKINRHIAGKVFSEENLDLMIASLAYGKYLSLCNTKTIKVYYLHGFFNQSYYGKIKSEAAVIYQKWISRNCDYIFANSYFTKMINQQFFGIRTNKVIYPCVSSQYFEGIDNCRIPKKGHTILYVGRLVSAKGSGTVLKALKILSNSGVQYDAYFAGDGKDKKELQAYSLRHNLNVHFLGRVGQKELIKYYSQCEVFVSLNPSEPFGIVFLEALLAQCKILCPYTGGQIEFLRKYSESVAFTDEQSPTEIANKIIELFDCICKPQLQDEQRNLYRYKKAAQEIIEYIKLTQSERLLS